MGFSIGFGVQGFSTGLGVQLVFFLVSRGPLGSLHGGANGSFGHLPIFGAHIHNASFFVLGRLVHSCFVNILHGLGKWCHVLG